jgi:hypothetical protein
MNVLSASCWSMVVLVSFGDAGLAQKSTAPRPEVHSIPGIGFLLPRQAGSKDAPDISLLKPNAFELQSGTSRPWIGESGATTGGTAPQKQAPPR